MLNRLLSLYRINNILYTMGITSGAGTAYLSGAPEFIPGF